MPVSNPKANEIYLLEHIHSNRKEIALSTRLSSPTIQRLFPPPYLKRRKKKKKKLITLHYATDGVLNTVFQAVGVKKKSPSCHTSLVLQRT